MVKDCFKFSKQEDRDQLIIDGEDLQVVITFKTDRYRGVVSKRRRLVMEYDLRDLFHRVSYENPNFKGELDRVFGVLGMRDIPPERWKDQADYLL